MAALIFVVISIIIFQINRDLQNLILEYLTLSSLIMATLISIIGLTQVVRGWRETRGTRFYISLFLNFIIGIGFSALMIVSIIAMSNIEH